MIHVLLRIGVWVAVFAVGYLLFGPSVFDSGQGNPFRHEAPLYLPPAKPPQLLAYESAQAQRALASEEQAAYRALEQDWRAQFWQGDGLSVSDALSGVATGRKAHLVELLAARGLGPQEVGVFLMVVERDRPELLQDR